MTKKVHFITNIDLEAKTAECSNCGLTPISYKHKGEGVRCYYRAKYGPMALTITRKRTDHCEICLVKCQTIFDHDHATGKHRGWLCSNCNTMLGRLGDDAEAVERLLNYLRKGG